MTIRPDKERLLLLALNGKETAYGDGLATVNKLFPVRKLDPERKPTFANDEATFNGVDGPTRQDIEKWEGNLPIGFDLTPSMAGWMYALGMGAVATTTPFAGVYQHVFTEIAGYQNPSTNVAVKEATSAQRKYKGVVCGKFTEKISMGNKRLEATMDLHSDGTVSDDVTATPAITQDIFWRGGDTTLTINATPWTAKVVDIETALDNGLEADTAWKIGGGMYRTSHERHKERTRTLKVTLAPADSTDLNTIKGWIENQTALALVVTTTGGIIASTYHFTNTWSIPKCQVKSSWKLAGGIGAREQIVLELEVLYDTVTSKFWDRTVISDVATYLV